MAKMTTGAEAKLVAATLIRTSGADTAGAVEVRRFLESPKHVEISVPEGVDSSNGKVAVLNAGELGAVITVLQNTYQELLRTGTEGNKRNN